MSAVEGKTADTAFPLNRRYLSELKNMTALTTLEGDKIYLPGSGIYVDRDDIFSVKLHSYKDILNNTPHLRYNTELHGIAEHMEREGFMVGDDGIIYAVNPGHAQTLAGGSEIAAVPVGFLDGDELGKGFKFKMPKFKFKNPFKKKKRGFMSQAGGFATDVFRATDPIGMLGKKGLIGRNIGALSNPFKSFGKGIGSIFGKKKKGGFKLPGMDMETLMQIQEAQQQAAMPQEPEEVIEEESVQEEAPAEESFEEPAAASGPYQPMTNLSNAEEPAEETPSAEEPAEVGSQDALFSLAKTGASFLPGGGFITQAMDAGFGMHKQQQAKSEAKKAQNQQLLSMLIANTARPKPRKVVVRKPAPAPRPAPVMRTATPRIETDQPNIEPTNTPAQTAKKDSGNSAMIMMGVGAVALIMLMKK